SAVQFDFYKLGRGASDFLPDSSVVCTGADRCGSDVDHGVFGGDLPFTSGGLTVHATSNFTGGPSTVIQDREPGWSATVGAGLGVYHTTDPVDTSDDNITAGEMLTLTFDQVVTLSAIGLRADGHNFTNWADGSTFLFNGVSTLLPKGTGFIDGLSVTGSVFTFAYGGQKPDQFYLSSLTVAPVPEPETFALLAAGLALTGFIGRRRRSAV
ncbi:MAG: PEP-CTERM sorting domain-containing protein, partial [Caldimonas sp.]